MSTPHDTLARCTGDFIGQLQREGYEDYIEGSREEVSTAKVRAVLADFDNHEKAKRHAIVRGESEIAA